MIVLIQYGDYKFLQKIVPALEEFCKKGNSVFRCMTQQDATGLLQEMESTVFDLVVTSDRNSTSYYEGTYNPILKEQIKEVVLFKGRRVEDLINILNGHRP